ncbi:MAG: TonB-dependent receptor [Lentisphaeria bacterium]|nr:TonB-dependent receptor [Lentisphaeria bacterium]
MKKRLSLFVWVIVLVPALAFGQGVIKGTVTDAATGEALPGANVVVQGQPYGSASDLSGEYMIEGVPVGTYTITASVIGYEKASQTVAVASGITVTVNFQLAQEAIMGSALEVLASRATRETPVAYTDVSKQEMAMRLGSRDIPLVINTAPSVYATQQGGGAGDARINVRGFNQRNVAIMINGVPVNDMENGWVYWSNWDGVGDATSSIQLQRGLSAVNLATPSIGGTMNILTDPAAHKMGGVLKQEIGSWGFMKTTANFNTGLLSDRFALSGTVVRKTGDGFYKGTWTDAWAYYLGASYALNSSNRFELYAVGAPQRHGQNLYMQNIARYSQEYAEEVFEQSALDSGALAAFSEAGRDFNQNVGDVSSSYSGQQFFNMYGERTVDRYSSDFINERENYYHKPQVNLNWYLNLTEAMRLSTVAYFSGGSGGGTGTLGSVVTNYGPPAYGQRDWNAEIAQNSSNIDSAYSTTLNKSGGILRNSVNSQWTIGAISKLNYDISENLKTVVGVDWRTAEIYHYREVRDLLGGDYFVDTSNDFDTTPDSQMKKLGDKVAYNFTNNVDWFGVFAQGEYKTGPLTAFGMYGWSQIQYKYTNHFWDASNDGISGNENDDGELYMESPKISAGQIKGGASFEVMSGLRLFANLGFVNKVPIFDNVIDDYNGAINDDPKPEKFTSYEGGLDYRVGNITAKANYYSTIWKDQSVSRSKVAEDGTDGLVSLEGVNSHHSGFEAELGFQPMQMFRLDGSMSIGNWIYTDDVQAIWRPDLNTDPTLRDTLQLFIKDLKVGDAPQTQFALAASVYPISGMSAQLVMKYYDNFYAQYEPFDRDDNADRAQSWKIPAYTLFDFHGSYMLPINVGGIRFEAFAHIFNLMDSFYVQDAVDNSQYNAFTGDGKNHAADDAEVFLGAPRSFNAGLTLHF